MGLSHRPNTVYDMATLFLLLGVTFVTIKCPFKCASLSDHCLLGSFGLFVLGPFLHTSDLSHQGQRKLGICPPTPMTHWLKIAPGDSNCLVPLHRSMQKPRTVLGPGRALESISPLTWLLAAHNSCGCRTESFSFWLAVGPRNPHLLEDTHHSLLLGIAQHGH